MNKRYGTLIAIIGIVACLFSLSYSATVGSEFSSSGAVYNNGLLNDRTNYVIVSCFTTLIGILIMLLGESDPPKSIENTVEAESI